MLTRRRLKSTLYGLTALLALSAGAIAHARSKHYKVFLDMSYSGNIWQAEAANGIKALAATPPYNKEVTFKTVISGTNVQHQISDLESMVAAGANAILVYPLSPTALNRVIHQACRQHVLVFAYDSTVTAPCAYNVSVITDRYGANTAQWMVNEMGGKGQLVINKGVAGTSVTKTYDAQAMKVFRRYPGIKIVGQFYGNWNDALSQEGVARMLAAHPHLNAIWTVDGTYGSLQAVLKHRPDKLVTIAGQSNNGYRLLMASKTMQAKGLRGLSSSSGPSVGPYAFKVMMEVLTGQLKLKHRNVQYPLPWVPYQKVKMCEGDRFVNGCNVFPAKKVPPLFIDTSLNANLLPELNLTSIKHGTPTPGAHIEKLPPVSYGSNLPGINCNNCSAPADAMEPNLVKPIPVPR